MSQLHLNLAQQLGQIFNDERQPEELKSPTLAQDAQNLLKNNPQTYGKILACLLDGHTVPLTAKRTKQNLDLVRFISRFHPECRAAAQANTIANLEESLHSLSSRQANEAHNIHIKDVPRAIASTTEQLALLTGHATTRVEITNIPSRQKLAQLYDSLHLKQHPIVPNA
jgi:hypothetical protein